MNTALILCTVGLGALSITLLLFVAISLMRPEQDSGPVEWLDNQTAAYNGPDEWEAARTSTVTADTFGKGTMPRRTTTTQGGREYTIFDD